MISAIEYATKHFCTGILELNLKQDHKLDGEFYAASIPVFKNEDEYHFYLYFKKGSLKLIAKKLLDNTELNDDELSDLCKEIANQIVGYAKNLLNDRYVDEFKLGTPEYLGMVKSSPVKLEESLDFDIASNAFKIGYKHA